MRNTFNRIFVILSCIALLVGMMVFPASASSMETDTSLINYFDYCTAETVFDFTTTDYSCTFQLHKRMYLRYIDCLVTGSIAFDGVSVTRGTVTSDLSVIDVGNGLYRIYGQVGGGPSAWSDEVTFNFSVTGRTQINFLSFKYSTTVITRVKDVASIHAGPADTMDATMPDTNTSVAITLSNLSYPGNYYGWVTLSNWRKYDAMDILIKVDTGGLSSLFVDVGGIAVPFTATFFDSGHGQIGYVESDYDSVLDLTEYYFLNDFTYQWVLIHVDCSTIMRNMGTMYIQFTGDLTPDYNLNKISLDSVTGLIYVKNDSVLVTLFSDLKEFLKNLFSPNDDVKEDISTGISNNESTEQDIMTGIDDIGSDPADIDIDVIIDQSGADTNLIAAFFSVFFNNVIILRTFWLAALFIVIGYIFHGQR